MKIPSHLNPTIVTTSGKVVRQGKGGVVIVDDANTPLIDLTEVSDEGIINIFMIIPDEAGVMPSEVQPTDGTQQWEILLNR